MRAKEHEIVILERHRVSVYSFWCLNMRKERRFAERRKEAAYDSDESGGGGGGNEAEKDEERPKEIRVWGTTV